MDSTFLFWSLYPHNSDSVTLALACAFDLVDQVAKETFLLQFSPTIMLLPCLQLLAEVMGQVSCSH